MESRKFEFNRVEERELEYYPSPPVVLEGKVDWQGYNNHTFRLDGLTPTLRTADSKKKATIRYGVLRTQNHMAGSDE